MRINYSTRLATGGPNNHVTVVVDMDEAVESPDDVAFALSLVQRLMDYDQQRLTATEPRGSQAGDGGAVGEG